MGTSRRNSYWLFCALIAGVLPLLFCGLCYLYARQSPLVALLLNWPLTATNHEPGWETTATLSSDRGLYQKGEPFHIRFTVKNTSGRTLILEREDGPAMDLTLAYYMPSITKRTSDRWSELHPDEALALHRLELRPGEEHTIEWTISDFQGGAGGISVHGFWQGSDGLLREMLVQFSYQYRGGP